MAIMTRGFFFEFFSKRIMKLGSIFLMVTLCSILIPLASHAGEITVGSGVKVRDLAKNTGAANMTIPIEIPPGRKGLAPNLALTYNSNRSEGWIGGGWELELGAIQRATKRGVNYSANDFVFIKNGSFELVPRGDWGANCYGSKIEGEFSKFYYNSSTGCQFSK
ncbi:MAG: SpvB/TcaC N-terminal domain-containing protein [Thermodesulfobacteriota bacterium]